MRQHPWLPVRAGWLLAGAAALALLTASRVYLSLALKDVAEPFGQILLGETLKWSLWFPVVPLIVAVDRRWGFGAMPAGVALALHAPMAVIVLAIHTLVMTLAGQAAGWYFALETARATVVIRLVHEGSTVLLVYAGVIALDHVRRHRLERERTRLAGSQLEAQLATERLRNLQAQLHPHFLFNALHAVAGLLRDGERERAVETVTELGDLLRTSLRQADRQLVRLAEELDFLEAYLDIQKARHGDRLEVVWDVDPTLASAQVPHLVLQPLVENAVRHGVERALLADEPGAKGRIDVVARREDERLVLEVLDNGPGPGVGALGEEPDAEPDEEAGGVGLANTRARLQALYGGAFRLEVSPREGGGTRSRVVIPFERAELSS